MNDTRPNIFSDQFSIHRGQISGEAVVSKAGGKELGGTLYEYAPGCEDMPLHIHHAMEELLIVLVGRPTLRTLTGDEELSPGDVVAFPRGRAGAHTVANRSDEPIRFLMLSTKTMPEVIEYPEQGTVVAATRPPFYEPEPGEDPADSVFLRFKTEDAI